MCAVCSGPLVQPPSGRPRQYCSQACRQRSYATRARKPAPRSDWWTPPEMRERVLASWAIGLDVAASKDNRVVESYLGLDHEDPQRRDALAWDEWSSLIPEGHFAYANPPYTPANVLSAFLARAAATAAAGRGVVALVPASTGTSWWWENIIDRGASVEFLRGRLAFGGPHAGSGTASVAPWACALVQWLPVTGR